MTLTEVLRRTPAQLVDTLKRELQLKDRSCRNELTFAPERIFSEDGFKKIDSANHEAVGPRFKRCQRSAGIAGELTKPMSNGCSPCHPPISLFDINQHAGDEQVKADSPERARPEKPDRLLIAHPKDCSKKYGPLYPRLTKSSRYDEVDAKEAAFQGVQSLRRESGYVGYKVWRRVQRGCTKFDQLILCSRTATTSDRSTGKMFVGPNCITVAAEPDALHLRYTDRKASTSNDSSLAEPFSTRRIFASRRSLDPVLPPDRRDSLRPLQARPASENQPANLARRKSKSKAKDTRAPDLEQGHFIRHRDRPRWDEESGRRRRLNCLTARLTSSGRRKAHYSNSEIEIG